MIPTERSVGVRMGPTPAFRDEKGEDQRMKKKISAILLALVMALCLLPAAAFADGTSAATCGDDSYPTLADAVAAEKDNKGAVIVLQKAVEEKITVPAGADLVLDLNGHELKAAAGTPVTVNGGKLTVKDSTAVQDCDYSGEVPAAQYKGGAIVAEKANGVQVTNGGEFTLLSGKVRAQNIGVSVVGNIAAGADREAIASKAYIKGGYVLCQEYGVSPQGKGAYISVEGDAFIEALDNAAVAGNGNVTDKEDRGGTTIDINGGIIVSHIQSAGYIACGIYHPQAGTLNITDGEIYAEKGVGILMRAGQMRMTGGFLVTTGDVTGKVGDSQANIGCDAIVVEGAPSKYPGIATGGLDAVIGGNAIILPQYGDTLKLNKVEVNGEEKGTLVVEGGLYGDAIAQNYLSSNLLYQAAVTYEYEDGGRSTMYSYYLTEEAAVLDTVIGEDNSYVEITRVQPWGDNDAPVTVEYFDTDGKLIYSTQYMMPRETDQTWTLPVLQEVEGKRHIGWTVEPNGEVYTEYTLNSLREKYSFTAVWADTAKVTYDYGYDSKTDTATVLVGETVKMTEPTREGYIFKGWLVSGTNTTLQKGDSYKVLSDVTFTAQWQAKAPITPTNPATGDSGVALWLILLVLAAVATPVVLVSGNRVKGRRIQK